MWFVLCECLRYILLQGGENQLPFVNYKNQDLFKETPSLELTSLLLKFFYEVWHGSMRKSIIASFKFPRKIFLKDIVRSFGMFH